ncbi:hypothetical protein [Haloarcula rubripromontorii]|uniref:hypothetical protein n=1 Tax=Haloarcula rubripromontorii TaxID=1705562 RepID=UPI00345C1906
MSNQDRAADALEQLQAIERADLDAELTATYEQAVDSTRALTEQFEEASESDEHEPETPEGWDEDEAEWKEKLETAREKADIPASKGTLTTKTIDGRDYYYLQWRDGETVTSQYVGPVTTATE